MILITGASGTVGREVLGEVAKTGSAAALLDLQAYYASGRGGAVDGVLERLLGRPAITLGRFLAEFGEQFQARGPRD
jgi:uncharacterized protein YbjT (DUF2867 family)